MKEIIALQTHVNEDAKELQRMVERLQGYVSSMQTVNNLVDDTYTKLVEERDNTNKLLNELSTTQTQCIKYKNRADTLEAELKRKDDEIQTTERKHALTTKRNRELEEEIKRLRLRMIAEGI
ncbi:hypothetical protein H3009_gp14 [Bacillus phage Harambe]|uniref:Uncharacterized protein n=1 Tax=Bacillus phage Harambe TaxID=1981931 RepID=A0A1W6JSB2_9CAUD|nr:hypothetical protein H3009_gp14 [Bacillus phage Harambe]ARM70163.1 hypothetical protein HARAMBE_14 [Bacillus phage Harambe]